MSIYRVSGWTDGLRSQQCPAWGREGQVHIGPSRACSASAGPLEVQAWLLHCAFTVGPEVALGHRVSTCMVRSEGTVGSGMWIGMLFTERRLHQGSGWVCQPTRHRSDFPRAPWESTGNELNSGVPNPSQGFSAALCFSQTPRAATGTQALLLFSLLLVPETRKPVLCL